MMLMDMISGVAVIMGLIAMFAAYCCLNVKKRHEDAFEQAYAMMRLAACCFLAAIAAFCIANPKLALPGLFH